MPTNQLERLEQPRRAAPGPPPEKLAVYGGPRAVAAKFHERWRSIRVTDIIRIVKYARRDISTLARSVGPIELFERKFAELTGSRYTLAMNSGTAALHSAYFAVGAKPGSEVIIPSYTFFASAAPLLQCGAVPVFCEVDPHTLTADPDDVERRITPRTRAICVVHVWGNPARMDRFVEIAARHKLALIEDCSHAHGALFQGRPVGSWGDIGCFSLQGSKAVSGGEAGIAVTSNPALFDRMLVLGHYGRTELDQKANTFEVGNLSLGCKYRPHLYSILLALGSLSRLEELNRRRRHNYDILKEELAGCEAVQMIEQTPDAQRGGLLEFILKYLPKYAGGWNRGAFVKAAIAEGVPIAVDRYKPLHQLPLFTTVAADLNNELCISSFNQAERPINKPSLPVTERVCEQLLTLPPFTAVPEDFIRQCARALRKVALQAAQITDYRSGS